MSAFCPDVGGKKKNQLQSLKNIACQAMLLSYEVEKGAKLTARCEDKQKRIRNKAHFLMNVSFKIKEGGESPTSDMFTFPHFDMSRAGCFSGRCSKATGLSIGLIGCN